MIPFEAVHDLTLREAFMKSGASERTLRSVQEAAGVALFSRWEPRKEYARSLLERLLGYAPEIATAEDGRFSYVYLRWGGMEKYVFTCVVDRTNIAEEVPDANERASWG